MSVSSRKRVRVVALASYPMEAASSRYRIVQFIEPLADRGIDIAFSPFLDQKLFAALYAPGKLARRLPSVVYRMLTRVGAAIAAVRADVVFVQREAMLFGPPVIEWLAARLFRKPLILDLDDATWISYVSPVYGRMATLLKWPHKTDSLIRWASVVACGSPHVANYVRGRGTSAIVVPTVVDTQAFRPRVRERGQLPVVGWIGTHGTYPYFVRLLPVFEQLAREFPFKLKVVGSGQPAITIAGIGTTDTRPWRLDREVEDFQSLDVGVYPIAEDAWSAGKSGLKAVQYMACGVPFVMSPVGVCATMGIAGETHLAAISDEDWYEGLKRLLTDEALRARMGAAGRAFAALHYGTDATADVLETLIRAATKT